MNVGERAQNSVKVAIRNASTREYNGVAGEIDNDNSVHTILPLAKPRKAGSEANVYIEEVTTGLSLGSTRRWVSSEHR